MTTLEPENRGYLKENFVKLYDECVKNKYEVLIGHKLEKDKESDKEKVAYIFIAVVDNGKPITTTEIVSEEESVDAASIRIHKRLIDEGKIKLK